MPLPEFSPHLRDTYPRLEDRWIPPRIRHGEDKAAGHQGKTRQRRETKRAFIRRICAQVTAQAGAYYDTLKAQHFVQNPLHVRNDFLRHLHNNKGQSYEYLRQNEPEAAGLSRSV